MLDHAVQYLVPTASETGRQDPVPAPTPPAAKSVSGQETGTPSRVATLIAELQNEDAAAVEAGLVGVREAFRRGDHSAIEEALIGQAVLLQALGEKFLRLAGNQDSLRVVELYTALSLRAMDSARKTLSTLGTMRGGPKTQTNVQVNVSAPTNDSEVPHE
jgi:hypothetical protein